MVNSYKQAGRILCTTATCSIKKNKKKTWKKNGKLEELRKGSLLVGIWAPKVRATLI
jgi:hypothetical protein